MVSDWRHQGGRASTHMKEWDAAAAPANPVPDLYRKWGNLIKISFIYLYGFGNTGDNQMHVALNEHIAENLEPRWNSEERSQLRIQQKRACLWQLILPKLMGEANQKIQRWGRFTTIKAYHTYNRATGFLTWTFSTKVNFSLQDLIKP